MKQESFQVGFSLVEEGFNLVEVVFNLVEHVYVNYGIGQGFGGAIFSGCVLIFFIIGFKSFSRKRWERRLREDWTITMLEMTDAGETDARETDAGEPERRCERLVNL